MIRKNSLKPFTRFLVTLAVTVFSTQVHAGDGSPYFTLEGELFDSPTSTTHLLDPAAVVRIQILDPGGTCVLYDEQQTVNTVPTDGTFNIRVGSNVGAGKRVAGSDPGNSVFQIYQNRSAITATGCAGSSYTPTAGANRLVRIIVTPSGTGVAETLTPDMSLDSVPTAMVAETLQGLTRDDFVRTGTVTNLTQTNVDTVFSNTNYPILTALLGGTSNLYEQSGKLNGVSLPSMTSGEVLGWNGTSWVSTSVAQNVTSVVGTSGDITVSNSSGAHTIDLATISGLSTGTYGSANQVSQVTVDSKGRVTNISNVTITGVAPGGSASGDLTGTYPGPSIAVGAVTSAKILDGTIAGNDLSSSISISTTGDISAHDITASNNIVATGNVGANSVSTRTIGIANAGNNTLSLTVPSGAFTNFSLVLPSGDGSGGQALKTDGAGKLYWGATTSGSVTSVAVDAPLSTTGGQTPTISIAQASGSANGYLSSGDWTAFNNKQDTTLANGKIWAGNASNAAAAVTPSGDVAMSNSGLFTVQNQAISYGKIQNVSATNRILGRATAGAGTIEEITLGSGLSLSGTTLSIGAGLGTVTNVTGTSPVQVATGTTTPVISMAKSTAVVDGYLASTDFAIFSNKLSTALASAKMWLGSAGGAATAVDMSGDATIANNGVLTIQAKAVTLAKMNDISTNSLIGRSTAGTGAPEVITLGSGLSLSGGVLSVGAGTGTVTNVTGNLPISVVTGASTPVISIAQANSTTGGYLTSGDWNVFNDKQDTNLANGKIWAGNVANHAAAVTPSGDISMSNSGVFTVGTNAISYSKIQNVSATNRILGRATAGAGVIEEITLGTGLSLSGTTLSLGTGIGTVTGVTGTSPVQVATGTTTPVISMARSTAAVDGYLASTDFATFSNKLSTALASAKMWIGSAGGVATAVDMSGDATIANNGVLTVQPKAITLAKMNDMSTNSILGRSTAGTGVPEVISVGAGLSLSGGTLQLAGGAGAVTAINVTAPIASTGGATPTLSMARSTAAVDGYLASSDFATFSNRLSTALASAKIWVGSAGGAATAVDLSGDATIANTGAMTIAPQAVSYSKIQNVSATNRILGRATAGAGTVEEITLGSGLSLSGTTLSIGAGLGTVTNVTGTAPVQVATGTTTPVISMAKSTASVDGYLASTDFATFSNKLSTALASAKMWVGSAGGAATAVDLSGDVSVANTGVVTIANKAVTLAKMNDMATASILGRSTAGTGVPEVITVGAGLSISGGTLQLAGGAGAITAINVNSPISSTGGATPTLSIARSTAAVDGYLASSDFATFSSKLSTALASAKIWVGSGGGAATAVDLSGDATIANTGAMTIAPQAVSYSKIQNVSATNRILGRATAGAGTVEEITLGSGLSLSGTTLSIGAGLGTVTSVTGTSPVQVATGTTTPVISMARSTAAVDGYLASPDFATFSNKLSTALASAKMWLGSAGGAATAVDMSGDATIANTGVVTIQPRAITLAKMNDMSTNSIVGRSTAGTGTPEIITVGTGLSLSGGTLQLAGGSGAITAINVSSPISSTGGTTPTLSIARSTAAVDGYLASSDFTTFSNKLSTTLASAKVWVGSAGGVAAPVDLSGDVSISNTGSVTIANKAVTLAKMNDMATASLLGRATAGTGTPEVITLGTGLSLSGTTLTLGSGVTSKWTTSGTNIYYNAGRVGIGTSSPQAGFVVSGDATVGKTTAALGGAKLDVSGAIVMSGSTSGYNGFQPLAVAGSQIWTLPSVDGTSGQVMKTNGSGALSWTSITTTPAGSNTQLQFNNSGAFGASSNLVWDNSNSRLGISVTPTVSLDVSGDARISNRLTTATTELILEQTGDTYGATKLRLRNRNGSNGAIFENAGLDLVDFGFLPNSGTSGQANLRWEHRSASVINALNTGGEFQFIDPNGPTVWFFSGKNVSSISSGRLGIGTNTPSAGLAVSGDMTVGKATAANGGAKLDVNGSLALSGSTSGYTGLKAAATSGSTIYTLPSNDGSSGQALTTNGTGTLSWATPSAGAAGSSSMLQFNSAGALSGSWSLTWSGTQLQVFNSILAGYNGAAAAYSSTSAGANTPTASSPYVLVQNQTGLDNAGAFLSLQAANTAATAQRAYIGAISQNGASGPAIVMGQQTGATAYAERVRISSAGNVGIGTASPTHMLHVNGDIYVPTQSGLLAVGTYGTISETAGGLAYITGNAVKASSSANNQIEKSAADPGQFMRMRYDTGISFHTNITGVIGTSYADNQNTRMLIDLNGNVGIGTTSPGATLDVKGKIAASATGTPTLSSCGTGSPSITGNDTRGTVSMGNASPSACTITFNSAYSSTPVCVVSAMTSTQTIYISSVSTTALTINLSAGQNGYSFSYICLQ